MDPMAMLAQLQRGGQQAPNPMVRAMGMMPQQAPGVGANPQPQYQAGAEEAESAAPTAGGSDEAMLESVQAAMGGGGPGGAQGGAAPPPGSAMKWMDVEEDRAALLADPSPENIQAFTDYWGADQLPPELQQGEEASDQGAEADY